MVPTAFRQSRTAFHHRGSARLPSSLLLDRRRSCHERPCCHKPHRINRLRPPRLPPPSRRGGCLDLRTNRTRCPIRHQRLRHDRPAQTTSRLHSLRGNRTCGGPAATGLPWRSSHLRQPAPSTTAASPRMTDAPIPVPRCRADSATASTGPKRPRGRVFRATPKPLARRLSTTEIDRRERAKTACHQPIHPRPANRQVPWQRVRPSPGVRARRPAADHARSASRTGPRTRRAFRSVVRSPVREPVHHVRPTLPTRASTRRAMLP